MPLSARPSPLFRLTLIAVMTTAAVDVMAQQPKVQSDAQVVVIEGITYRDRAATTEPTLTYGQEYFQRFEPSTAGDMIKRVPSAVFVSDVLEYDAVQLRGLAPAYTQVLVNGKKVPGGADDRSFWLDRIPAEMVDRVEVIRSAIANRSGDAMAGAINIVLREAYRFDGTYIRLGTQRYDDGKIKPTLGLVSATDALGGRILVSLNVQDRYNPKLKRSDRFDKPGGELTSFEDQTDTRDGQDYSGTLSYVANVGPGRLKLDGFVVRTARKETEVSTETEYDDGDTFVNKVPGLKSVRQTNWGLGAEYVFNLAGGTMEIGLEQSNFKDRSVEREEEYVYLNGKWDESTGEQTGFDSRDGETGLRLVHKRSLGQSELQLGMELRRKNRVTRYTEFQWEADKETDPVVYEEDGVIQSTIRERRTDPFVMLTGRAGPLQWQTGMRFESTRTTVESDSGTFNSKSSTLLPSLNLRYGLSEASRLSLSLAKTVRRPAFNTLLPELLDGEFGDNDYIGNPQLLLETATGVDLGFEQRLGRRGVLGINLFHRKVNRLIELVNTGEPSEAAVDDWEDDIKDYMKAKGVSRAAAVAANPFDPDSFVYTSRNVGSGKVWGVELDLASPLTALGLPETGVFFNYSWLNSSVRDFMGERRFNNQARSLMNVGFIHNLPQLQTSFGMSYRKQGTAFSRVLGEEITTTYGGDLDMFIEKRVGKSFSVRLAGTNLLNAKKKEVFNKFDTLSDQMKRKYDEYEVESEKAGPRLQLVARWAF